MKRDIFGVIWSSIWGIYTHAEHLEGVDITRWLTTSQPAILLLVFAFLVSLSITESSVEIWGMILMG